MLIKAKERKTLVSACGGCRKLRNMFLTLSLSLCLFFSRRVLFLRVSPPPPAAVVDVPGPDTAGSSACARDFYPAGVTTALQPCAGRSSL